MIQGKKAAHIVRLYPLRLQQDRDRSVDSPRGGRVQLTDLMLGVLAQFPESPERCHG